MPANACSSQRRQFCSAWDVVWHVGSKLQRTLDDSISNRDQDCWNCLILHHASYACKVVPTGRTSGWGAFVRQRRLKGRLIGRVVSTWNNAAMIRAVDSMLYCPWCDANLSSFESSPWKNIHLYATFQTLLQYCHQLSPCCWVPKKWCRLDEMSRAQLDSQEACKPSGHAINKTIYNARTDGNVQPDLVIWICHQLRVVPFSPSQPTTTNSNNSQEAESPTQVATHTSFWQSSTVAQGFAPQLLPSPKMTCSRSIPTAGRHHLQVRSSTPSGSLLH